MVRPPRIDFPNAVYHVTSRGMIHRMLRKSWRDVLQSVNAFALRLQDPSATRPIKMEFGWDRGQVAEFTN